jgi:hypothetical protein
MSPSPATAGKTDADLRPSPVPPSGLILPTLLGFLSVVAICVGGVLGGSPFDVRLPGAWAFGDGYTTPWVRDLGRGGLFLGVAGLLVAWLLFISYIRRRPETPVKTVMVVFGLWTLPLLVAPPMFSQDVYSYVAQGTMVNKGIDPYAHGAVTLRPLAPQVDSLVDPLWQTTMTPYGPLWLGLEDTAVVTSGHHEVVAVEELRLFALAGVVLAAACIPPLARRTGTSAPLAVSFAVLNPLTLIGLVSPGHNDALLAGLLLAALLLAARRQYIAAVVVCTLAGGIKGTALIAVLFLAWQWAGPAATWAARLRAIAAAGAISLGVMELLSLMTGVGWGWMASSATPGSVHSSLTPTTNVSDLLAKTVHLMSSHPDSATILSGVRALGDLGALAAIIWLALRTDHLGPVLALALALLAVVALGPVFQPWYMSWGLLCLAPVAVGRWRVLLLAVSIYGTVATIPRFEPFIESTGPIRDVFGLACLIGLVALTRPNVATRAAARTERLVAAARPVTG